MFIVVGIFYICIEVIIGVIKVKDDVKKIGIWFLVIIWNSKVFRFVVNKVILGLRFVSNGISISVLNVINSICVLVRIVFNENVWWFFMCMFYIVLKILLLVFFKFGMI